MTQHLTEPPPETNPAGFAALQAAFAPPPSPTGTTPAASKCCGCCDHGYCSLGLDEPKSWSA